MYFCPAFGAFTDKNEGGKENEMSKMWKGDTGKFQVLYYLRISFRTDG